MRALKNESGRSMIEMLGVIAIIGVITVGGITSVSYVDSYFRTNASLLEIEQMFRDLSDAYSWAPNYSDITPENSNTILCQGGNGDQIAPICDPSGARNRWGGTITAGHDGPDIITLEFSNVPKSVCERMCESANEILQSAKLTAPNGDDAATCAGSCGNSNDLTFQSI